MKSPAGLDGSTPAWLNVLHQANLSMAGAHLWTVSVETAGTCWAGRSRHSKTKTYSSLSINQLFQVRYEPWHEVTHTRDHSGSEAMSWSRLLFVRWQFWLSKFCNVYIQSFFGVFNGQSSHSFCANSTNSWNDDKRVHYGLQTYAVKTIVHPFIVVLGIGWFLVNWVHNEAMDCPLCTFI